MPVMFKGRVGALRRATDFRAGEILDRLLSDMGLGDATDPVTIQKPGSLWGELLEIAGR